MGISAEARRLFNAGELGYPLSRELGLTPWEMPLGAVDKRDPETWDGLIQEAPHRWERPVALYQNF